MRRGDVRAEIGDIVAGRKPGRVTHDEIKLFDSPGLGILDVAASARAYKLGGKRGSGRKVRLCEDQVVTSVCRSKYDAVAT